MRKWIGIIAVLCVMLSGAAKAGPALPRSVYCDKVQGGMVGHVAGLLTGFEFVWDLEGRPRVPLPEEWFELLKGPYGGGNPRGGAGVSRMLENGIGSDDDYHIDFFNQLILAKCGVLPSHTELMAQWRGHAVSDWGGGDKAMEIIRKHKLTPPYTGLREYGNIFHWCTEAYIENETLGLVAPGMPVTALRLAERFASITGDYESVDWALFWATAYAQAFLLEDGAQAIAAAADTLPVNSHSRHIYDECVTLYQKGATWETAVKAIEAMRFEIYQCNNIQCSPDVNNGFAVLAVLYGKNDWLTSVKYASICGYDADCTAATVGGLIGIIKGLDGLPREVLDIVWQDGNGVYVNDTLFPPHIAKDYPAEQTFSGLAELYIANGLKQIEAAGGRIENETLFLPEQTLARWAIQLDDFEAGMDAWQAGEGAKLSLAGEAHTGDVCAEVKLENSTNSASLSRQVQGLIPGAVYRLSAYVKTDFDGQAFIQAEGARVAAYNANKGWVLRELYFKAENEAALIRLTAARTENDPGLSAWFDDIRLEQVDTQIPVWLAIESKTLEKRDAVEWNVSIPEDGDWALMVEYTSAQRTGQVMAQFSLDGQVLNNAAFPGTGQEGQKGSYTQLLPVRAEKGEHQVALTVAQGTMTIHRVGLMRWPSAAIEESLANAPGL